jgi:hypothetical protein
MPPDCVARFLCTKHSWRGKYRRILCITPSAIVTQHIDNLAITNTWDFVGETDVDDITVGASDTNEQDFVIMARQDRKVRRKLLIMQVMKCCSMPEGKVAWSGVCCTCCHKHCFGYLNGPLFLVAR